MLLAAFFPPDHALIEINVVIIPYPHTKTISFVLIMATALRAFVFCFIVFATFSVFERGGRDSMKIGSRDILDEKVQVFLSSCSF